MPNVESRSRRYLRGYYTTRKGNYFDVSGKVETAHSGTEQFTNPSHFSKRSIVVTTSNAMKHEKNDVDMGDHTTNNEFIENPLLDAMNSHQKSRFSKTCSPESIRSKPKARTNGNRHGDAPYRNALVGPSKFSKKSEEIRTLREETRQEKLQFIREKLDSRQSRADYVANLNADFGQKLQDVEIDQLVEEERAAVEEEWAASQAARPLALDEDSLQQELDALLSELQIS